jgi:hypothetical protein
LYVEFVPVEHDHARLARERRAERLPEEVVETVVAGWWTTCLEVLLAKERTILIQAAHLRNSGVPGRMMHSIFPL